MSQYARQTEVPVEKTRNEIQKELARYGATAFGYVEEGNTAAVAFKLSGRAIRIILPLPTVEDFRYTESGRHRNAADRQRAWEQGIRSRWRSLLLVIKAKLEAIESGITTLEREFLADVLLPDGSTVGQWMQPQVEKVYLTGKMPAMLPMLDERPALGSGVQEAEIVEG